MKRIRRWLPAIGIALVAAVTVAMFRPTSKNFDLALLADNSKSLADGALYTPALDGIVHEFVQTHATGDRLGVFVFTSPNSPTPVVCACTVNIPAFSEPVASERRRFEAAAVQQVQQALDAAQRVRWSPIAEGIRAVALICGDRDRPYTETIVTDLRQTSPAVVLDDHTVSASSMEREVQAFNHDFPPPSHPPSRIDFLVEPGSSGGRERLSGLCDARRQEFFQRLADGWHVPSVTFHHVGTNLSAPSNP